jgi:hypothetical protein
MDLDRFSAKERTLIARIEKAEAELDTDRRGWGFFHAGDEALALIKDLPGVQFLDLFEACDDGAATDEGLAHLRGMQSLVCLRLGPGITDQGLVHLRELVGLRELRLDSTADVSDEGLAHLTGLTGLEELSLQFTDISDAGLASLAGLVHLTELTLDGTEITDAGLKQLRGCAALKKISLNHTGVSKQGVAALQKAIPACKVSWEPPVGEAKQEKVPPKKKPAKKADGADSALPLRMTLKGGTDLVSNVDFSPDAQLLISTASSKIVVWELVTGTKLRELKCPIGIVMGARFSPDGKTILGAANSNLLRRWDATTGKPLEPWTLETKCCLGLASCPERGLFAVPAMTGQVFLCNWKDGSSFNVLPLDATALQFGPGGKVLAAAGKDVPPTIVELPEGRVIVQMRGHELQPGLPGYVAGRVAFSPDGRTLASTGGGDGKVRLWDVSTGEAKDVLSGHAGPVSGLAFHPEGRVLASGGGPYMKPFEKPKDQEIRLWDVATGQDAGIIPVPAERHSALRFSPDGATLFANGKGGTILAFDATSLNQ